MTYAELKEQHSAEFNAFPKFFAVDQRQFVAGMQKLGVIDPHELHAIFGNGYIREDAKDEFFAMNTRHYAELQAALADREFLIDAFDTELSNHEYCYSMDHEIVLEHLNIQLDTPLRQECFLIARSQYMERIRSEM